MKKIVGSIIVTAVIIAAFNWQRIGYELIVAPWFSTKNVKLRGAFFRTRGKYIVDADEIPACRLKFVSASVGPATRKEWEEWPATKNQRPPM